MKRTEARTTITSIRGSVQVPTKNASSRPPKKSIKSGLKAGVDIPAGLGDPYF